MPKWYGFLAQFPDRKRRRGDFPRKGDPDFGAAPDISALTGWAFTTENPAPKTASASESHPSAREW